VLVNSLAAARRATRRRVDGQDEAGFTLIELLVVIVVLPIIVGGISVALISVFTLQGNVSNRVGDSNDALVGSVNFNRDVQSAEQMTTQSTPACGASTQTQLLGLEWGANTSAPGGYDNVVSYISTPVVNPQTGKTTYTLLRQQCSFGTSSTPTTTFTIAHDIGSPTLTIRGANNADVTSSFANWTSTLGVTGVTFGIQAPGSQYSYSLVGLPGESTSQSLPANLTNPSGPGCAFAASGSGTYANQLCFADFTGFNGTLHSNNPNQCQTMTRPIANAPYSLKFCVSVSQNNVAPASIPTYYSPQGDNSEAFLGNNGFYTGIAGNPALYQTSGGVTTVYLTNVQVLDAAGQPATGWTLVTGDAESTDTGEWMVFQSNLNWSVLNNSPGNPFGNSCYDSGDDFNNKQNVGFLQYTGGAPPTTNGTLPSNVKAALPANGATFPATGTNSVLCESDQQLNKTGALMVQAQEPTGSSAAQTLTVTMRGGGLEGMFLGVLL